MQFRKVIAETLERLHNNASYAPLCREELLLFMWSSEKKGEINEAETHVKFCDIEAIWRRKKMKWAFCLGTHVCFP